MQAPNTLRASLFEHLIFGLQAASTHSKCKSLQERKSVFKLSADVAVAVARGSSRKWTRALVSYHSRDAKNGALLRAILGDKYERFVRPCTQQQHCYKMERSKKILRRSRRLSLRRKDLNSSVSSATALLARRMLKRRTQLLKRLIPGGECLSGFSLLNETLDYVVSLRAQVDLMQYCLWNATQASTAREFVGRS